MLLTEIGKSELEKAGGLRMEAQYVWPWPLTCCHFFLHVVIPKVTKHLLSNPVFTCIILAACMEIAVVAGFAAFLGKYLEQQFNLTTSSANQLLGECVPLLFYPVSHALRIYKGPEEPRTRW